VVRRLLLVLPSTSYRADAYVTAARRLSVELTFATDQPRAFAEFGRPAIQIDLGSPEAAAEMIAGTQAQFDAVLGTDDASALVAAVSARQLGLRGNDPDGVFSTHDKRRMRERLAHCGVRQPNFRVIEPTAEPGALGNELRFPCVVKAPMLSGSQGVIRADGTDELRAAVARIRLILRGHSSAWREHADFGRILVEDYIDGPEVAVEALIDRGKLVPIAIFDKPDRLSGPFFEETLYVSPSRLPLPSQRDILDTTACVVQALGLVTGPVHAELRIGARGAELVEIAARSIGGLCSHAFDYLTGNLEGQVVAQALGLPYEIHAPRSAAGVMMIPLPRNGVLREVSGQSQAEEVPGVQGVTISARLGEALHRVPEGSSYLGFIFATGASPEAVEHSLRVAHGMLRCELSPLLSLSI